MKGVVYALFAGLFVVEILVASVHWKNVESLEPWWWALLGLATFRGARSISYNNDQPPL